MRDGRGRQRTATLGGLLLIGVTGGAWAQQLHPYVSTLKQEYAAVLAHGDQPCAHETANQPYIVCMGKELEYIAPHLDAFVGALRLLMKDADTERTQSKAARTALDDLNKTDAAWRGYRTSVCGLQFDWYAGGTLAPAAQAECELKMDRAYVQQLADTVNLHQLAD